MFLYYFSDIIITLFVIFILLIFLIFFTRDLLLNRVIIRPEGISNEQMVKRLQDNKELFKGTLHKIYIDSVPIQMYIYLKHPDEKQIVLYCHGNSGHILKKTKVIEMFEKQNISLCLFDYRGYGISYGQFKPNIESMTEDAIAVFDFLEKLNLKVIVWGESLGSLITCNLCNKRNPQKVILFAPFTGIRNALNHNGLSLLNILIPWNLKIDTKSIKCPTLVIYSKQDFLYSEQAISDIKDKWLMNQVQVNERIHSGQKLQTNERIHQKSQQNSKTHLNDIKIKYMIIEGTHSKPILEKGDIDVIKQFINV